MLSPYAYAPATVRHLVPSVEPVKPARSPYDPPSDLAPGAKAVRTHELLKKGDVTFSREITWSTVGSEKPRIVSNRLIVESGNDADNIQVRSWPGDKLQFIVNGKSYVLDAQAQQGPQPSLLIKANGGDDKVSIDDDVMHVVEIHGGEGNDILKAGGGPTGLFGGGGNDELWLGRGFGYAQGDDGNDLIVGGYGTSVMFGNNGNDRIYSKTGAKDSKNLMFGGDGNDVLYAPDGENHLNGGNGNNQLFVNDRTTRYNGGGSDRVQDSRSENEFSFMPLAVGTDPLPHP